MAYSLIGEVLHEWLGTAMLLLFIIHHILNFNWCKTLRKGRYSIYRIFQTLIVGLLLLTMLGSMISGIILSQYVFDFLLIKGGQGIARTIHLLCSYWGFLLMNVHLGLHWEMIMGVLHHRVGMRLSLKYSKLCQLAVILIAVYGVISFYRNDIFSYLLLRTHFVLFDFDQPLILFFLEYLSMMVLFIFLSHTTKKFLQKTEKRLDTRRNSIGKH